MAHRGSSLSGCVLTGGDKGGDNAAAYLKDLRPDPPLSPSTGLLGPENVRSGSQNY